MRRKTEQTRQSYTTAEAKRKLLQMMQFIEQEGLKREQEIDRKSEEEYNIVKWNTIKTEQLKIAKQYEAKEIRSKQESQIVHGKIMHIGQMQIIENKLEIFDDIENDVRNEIKKNMSKDKSRLNVLQSLIMEALFKLLEEIVIIKCKETDVKLIESIIPNIRKDYERAAHKPVTLRIDDTYLPTDGLPGVICRTPNNKISVNNTLDDRLKQILKSSVPVINHILFGTSKMRQ